MINKRMTLIIGWIDWWTKKGDEIISIPEGNSRIDWRLKGKPKLLAFHKEIVGLICDWKGSQSYWHYVREWPDCLITKKEVGIIGVS
jgi:hypothetical protein